MTIVKANRKMRLLLRVPMLGLSGSRKEQVNRNIDEFFELLSSGGIDADEGCELWFDKPLASLRYILNRLDSSTVPFSAIISVQFGACANTTVKVLPHPISPDNYDIDTYRQPTLIAVFGV